MQESQKMGKKITLQHQQTFSYQTESKKKKPIWNPVSSSKMSLLLVLYLDPLDKQRNEFFK
jgi:hypothetical protein